MVNLPRNKWVIGGVVVGGGVIAYSFYSSHKKKQAAAQAAATSSAAAASGYGYGAAYGYGSGAGAFYGYGEPGITYGYGASGGFPAGYYGYGTPNPPQPAAATTNAQWAQAAISQLTNDGYDPMTVSAALGAYELGREVSPQQVTIIQAAIGVEGYPPDSGKDGFPPGIKTGGTPGGGQGTRQYVTAPGNETLGQIGEQHGDSVSRVFRINPTLAHYGKRDIPKGTKVRVS